MLRERFFYNVQVSCFCAIYLDKPVTEVDTMIIFTLFGCDAFHLFPDEDSGVSSVEEETAVLNPIADIEWTDEKLIISIENGSGYEFIFGIAETSTECSVDTQYGCWTAEDCGSGYLSPQGDYPHQAYCHPLSELGGELEYSESIYSVIAGLNDNYVVAGKETAFPAPTAEESYEFQVTYYLQALEIGTSGSETECWVWGLEPDHFSDRNCKVPLPMSNHSTQRFILPLGSNPNLRK